MAVGRPDQDYLEKLLNIFYTKEKRAFFVRLNKGKIIGIIGLDCSQAPYGWITHIAVHPDFRKKGIGRNMINEAAKTLSLTTVGLETDQDVVDFYRACGFTTIEVFSRWPGTHRYQCTRGQWPENMLEYYNNLEHSKKV